VTVAADTNTLGSDLVAVPSPGVSAPAARTEVPRNSPSKNQNGLPRTSKPADAPPSAQAAGRDLALPKNLLGRRLHAGHFAFMRAVVQGVDVAAAWDRYLRVEGESSDARAVRSTVAWIRDEFAAAAQRHARYGVARLVRLDSARLASGQRRVPSLDEFALDRGLEDFSQAEQLGAFEAEYREVLRHARRRERLIERQLEALGWLESLTRQFPQTRRVAQPPCASDAVDVWINPLLARHLKRAGLATLGELVQRINGIGLRWYAPIRGLGPVKAERILKWLRDHEASIAASGGSALGQHIDRPRAQITRVELDGVTAPATAVRPLEKLIVPRPLDGSGGLNRRLQSECSLKLRTDTQAVLAWLKSKVGVQPGLPDELPVAEAGEGGSGGVGAAPASTPHDPWKLTHTQRSYRKEAERLLLWSVIERGKALSSLSVEDCVAYREFLGDPQPRERWCAARSRERWSPLWRPFEGPLSPAAQRQAVRILGNLFNFLVHHNYLARNPWAAIRMPEQEPVGDFACSFTVAQWRFVQRQLASLPDSAMNRRLRLALEFVHATGLRLSEAVAAKVEDLRQVDCVHPNDPRRADGWVLLVGGKAEKLREVPVPPELIKQLGRSLAARGLADNPLCGSNRGVYLLEAMEEGRAVRSGHRRAAIAEPAGLAPSTLATQLKRFFIACGQALADVGDARGAEQLRKASTHWLRRTHATHPLKAGVPTHAAHLAHASLAVNSIHASAEVSAG
jgi:site-specific recombinase XerD